MSIECVPSAPERGKSRGGNEPLVSPLKVSYSPVELHIYPPPYRCNLGHHRSIRTTDHIFIILHPHLHSPYRTPKPRFTYRTLSSFPIPYILDLPSYSVIFDDSREIGVDCDAHRSTILVRGAYIVPRLVSLLGLLDESSINPHTPHYGFHEDIPVESSNLLFLDH
ncbi:hypothetical protein PMAYCL1PPCAC_18431 [Pristionchus mayeri]|uniref:Uncharacterized protein n=1 Tax=Pristionchus mayeri TaxID=1317129 RepID=A0AAN5CPG9_9BILA|nr:hypothetical protein PMAYCL1PPCAC_18431 [Pristionchus mayeri]